MFAKSHVMRSCVCFKRFESVLVIFGIDVNVAYTNIDHSEAITSAFIESGAPVHQARKK